MCFSIAIVLDGEFGARLHSLQADAVWIANSPTNMVVVDEIRRERPDWPITSFRDTPHQTAAEALAGILPVVDLHHGPLSQDPPYGRIVVYGCRLNHAARAAILEFNFEVEEETPHGFAARLPARGPAQTRQIILGLLELISDAEAQRSYEVEVPIASVPGEMICMWFDDHYHPDTSWFRNAFSDAERRVLAEFSALYEANLPLLRSKATVAALHSMSEWKNVMHAARQALAAFPGEQGDIYPGAEAT